MKPEHGVLKPLNPDWPEAEVELKNVDIIGKVVSVIKTLFNGRILSIRKKATYTNPDCHLVKFLEDKGELKFITVGCGMHTIAKSGL